MKPLGNAFVLLFVTKALCTKETLGEYFCILFGFIKVTLQQQIYSKVDEA